MALIRMRKTTASDFEIFKAEVNRWCDRFGLFGWERLFQHDTEGQNEEKQFEALCETFLRGRVVTFTLAKMSGRTPRENAFHEACELLLMRMRHLADSRDTHESEVDEEIHHLIQTLTRVLKEREPCCAKTVKNGSYVRASARRLRPTSAKTK